MPITINGTGSITGVTAGGLPSGSVTTANIADANITAAKLDGAQSGSAPIYAARAWVNFNGTGVVAIRASGNVSSITDNGVGRFRVNMTNAMADTNYVVVGSVLNSTTPAVNGISWVVGSDDPGATIGSSTTTSFHIGTFSYPTTAADFQYTQVAIFR